MREGGALILLNFPSREFLEMFFGEGEVSPYVAISLALNTRLPPHSGFPRRKRNG